MTAIAIIVAALLLGHDVSKAIGRLTDALLSAIKKELSNDTHKHRATRSADAIS